MLLRYVFLYAALFFSAARNVVLHADWPSFLGGSAHDSIADYSPPLQWSADQNIRWTADLIGHGQSSPVVVGDRGYTYFTNRAVVLDCIDAETGETAYTARIADSNLATPVGIGDHVFVFGKDGTTTVLKSGPKEVVVGENVFWSAGDDSRGNFGGEIHYPRT